MALRCDSFGGGNPSGSGARSGFGREAAAAAAAAVKRPTKGQLGCPRIGNKQGCRL